jgi:hypothetical protein
MVDYLEAIPESRLRRGWPKRNSACAAEPHLYVAHPPWFATLGNNLYIYLCPELEVKMDRPISVFLVLLSTCVSLSAQWLQYPEPGIPRTPDGKPNLSAPPPKTPDGKPDFSGVWAVANSQN